MRSLLWTASAVLLLVAGGVAPAADDTLAGNWKVKLPTKGGMRLFWLIQVEQADGKWAGKVLAKADEETVPATVSDVSVADGLLRLTLNVQKTKATFEGKVPTEKGKPLYGTLLLGAQLVPVELEPTALKSLDSFELRKEELAKATNPMDVFNASLTLLSQAGPKKAKPEEVRAWAEKAAKAAEAYGPRQQREIATAIAELLADDAAFADVALNYARRAERTLDPKEKGAAQRRVLQALATALAKTGKADEAKEVEARLKKIPAVEVTPFAGRQGKSDRVVLVELFTGAQCPPCVAADLAFDALRKTFKPTEAVLLQYHLHVPGPDPLTNADAEARQDYYGRFVRGTPTVIFNGQPVEGNQGGGIDQAQNVYGDFRDIVESLLEKAGPKLKLTASAVRKGNKVEINAEVSGGEGLPAKSRLRLALVEDEVAYVGANRQPTHQNVVRAMPGGASGALLKDGAAKQTVTVDLDELRTNLQKYLTNWQKENDPIRGPLPPIELKNLRLVAFVQSDTNLEVLQATQVDVKAAE